MPIKIAIVEDNRAALDEYVMALAEQSAFSVVGGYQTVKAALKELPSIKPDVILMDIRFPVGSGIECTRELKAQLPDTVILMLTVVEDDDDIFAAIREGADGYILKSARRQELLAAVHQVAAGGSPMTPIIARKLLRLIQRGTPISAELASLSSREREILELIAKGLRDSDVATQLDLSVETVGSYLRRIYRKLHVRCRTEAAAKLLSATPLHGRPKLR